MKFIQHYSGSTGNLYEVVANNGKRLLIDPGVSWPKVQESLRYDLRGIVACLLSHEHQDHSKAIKDVMRAGIDVYTSPGTASKFEMAGRRMFVLCDSEHLKLDTFDVAMFNSNHDAEHPMIMVIKCDGEYLLFATDTSHINQRFDWKFSIIAIECSYNKAYLAKRVREKTINEELAKRLLSSHMEEKEAMRYMQEFCDLSKCSQIHLLHLSADNINKKRIREQFEAKFFVEVITI